MRRAIAVLLGFLLVLGSTSFGMGHVHAAPEGEDSAGLHVGHVHLDSAHHADHGEPAPAREPAIDHDGSDAITLAWVASQAMPKRALPCLAAAPFFSTAPNAPESRRHHRADDLPDNPPLHGSPPGRAPPA